MHSKITIDFDKELLEEEGYNIKDANEELINLMTHCGLKKTSSITYESGFNGEDGFVDSLMVMTKMLEEKFWYLKYVNKFIYEDDEVYEDSLDELHTLLLEDFN